MQRSRLGEVLLKSGKLTESQLKTALNYQKSLGGKLGTIITKLGFISDDELTQLLAKTQKLPIIDLGRLEVPPAVLEKLPRETMEKHQVVPVQFEDETLTLAMWDPTDFEAIEEIQFHTGLRVAVKLAPRTQIQKALTVLFDQGPLAVRKKRRADEPAPAALEGRLPPAEADLRLDLTSWEMRRALIPLLIDQGVISEEALRAKAKELFGG